MRTDRESLLIADADGDEHEYAVASAPRGLDEWAVLIERLDTEDTYRVAVDARGQWRCSCGDFKYRHHPSRFAGCKHVERVKRLREAPCTPESSPWSHGR